MWFQQDFDSVLNLWGLSANRLALISDFQLITQTYKWCYVFWQNSGNAQSSDVKATMILIEFLIGQNKINWIFFKD